MNILLVHGLGRTPVSMFGLASALRKAGHHTAFFGYLPALESLPQIVRRLTAKLDALGSRTVGLVGHSLGGLLLRMTLHKPPRPHVKRLVMLGTPNRPPRAARWAWQVPPFRSATRDCGRLLATPSLYDGLPPVTVPCTVIAGTAGPCGRFSPFGPDPNDGIVAVRETQFDDVNTPVLVPAYHSILMDDFRVRQLVVAMMESGTD